VQQKAELGCGAFWVGKVTLAALRAGMLFVYNFRRELSEAKEAARCHPLRE